MRETIILSETVSEVLEIWNSIFSVMFMSISELVDYVSLPLFRGIIRPQIATVATASMSKTIRFLAPILSENQSESEQEEYW